MKVKIGDDISPILATKKKKEKSSPSKIEDP